MFTRKDLFRLIVPLLIEQLLAVTVGMADTMMIAAKGEAAMSGVSLVDTINILLIGLFSALATGGAVVAAQYIGHKEIKKAGRAAEQLLLAVTVLSVAIMGICLIFNKGLLHLIYGTVDETVMNDARLYFYISALSYPFLAVYNACAALYRAMGNSKISMQVSVLMNLINVAGNAICLFALQMGVEGVAIPSLVSRLVAGAVMLLLLRSPKNQLHITKSFRFGVDMAMIKRILKIAVPSGLENSIFQLGKILVQGVTASFGIAAIAGNAAANTVASLEVIPGNALGLAMITVVGQCVGANDHKQMRAYTKKLLLATYLIMGALNVVILLNLDAIVALYRLSDETAEIARQLMFCHGFFCIFIWPLSFTLPNALRAANDVKFTMCTSIFSMWTFRILFSYILAKGAGLGVLGVWLAMIIDWAFRSLCFGIRFATAGYKKHAFPEKTQPVI